MDYEFKTRSTDRGQVGFFKARDNLAWNETGKLVQYLTLEQLHTLLKRLDPQTLLRDHPQVIHQRLKDECANPYFPDVKITISRTPEELYDWLNKQLDKRQEEEREDRQRKSRYEAKTGSYTI